MYTPTTIAVINFVYKDSCFTGMYLQYTGVCGIMCTWVRFILGLIITYIYFMVVIKLILIISLYGYTIVLFSKRTGSGTFDYPWVRGYPLCCFAYLE